jgi:hypothetical protein
LSSVMAGEDAVAAANGEIEGVLGGPAWRDDR